MDGTSQEQYFNIKKKNSNKQTNKQTNNESLLIAIFFKFVTQGIQKIPRPQHIASCKRGKKKNQHFRPSRHSVLTHVSVSIRPKQNHHDGRNPRTHGK